MESGGAAAFAKAIVGDSNNPELIWTRQMRGERLIAQIRAHLGSFPARLTDNSHLVYEYVPAPPVDYIELENEVWCHRYYLKNLCNTVEFLDWKLQDHVRFLQCLLEYWRAELEKKPALMNEDEAAELMGLDKEKHYVDGVWDAAQVSVLR